MTEEQLATKSLRDDKKLIDKEITILLQAEYGDLASEYTEFSKVAMESFAKAACNDGKRIRASLLLNAYKYSNGKKISVAVRAAIAIELIHAFMLIFDDIADESDLRRGKPTAHKFIEKFGIDKQLSVKPLHFGQTISSTAAVAGMHTALNIILGLKIDAEIKNLIAQEVNKSIIVSAHGQFNDIYNQSVPADTVDSETVLRVHKWKTAQYTFFNPIQVGILLAGKSIKDTEIYKDYSMNSGIAFQIQDDIIGVFGNSDKSGKPNTDDLREGKVTLLIAEALNNSSSKDKKQLIEILNKKTINQADLNQAQRIIIESGSLDKSKKLAEEYCYRAVNSLHPDAPEDFRKYLIGISRLSTTRSR